MIKILIHVHVYKILSVHDDSRTFHVSWVSTCKRMNYAVIKVLLMNTVLVRYGHSVRKNNIQKNRSQNTQ